MTSDKEILRTAIRLGTLVWANKFMFVYRYNGEIYTVEPPQGVLEEVAKAVKGEINLFDEAKYGVEVHPTGRPVRAELEEIPQLDFDPAVVMQLTSELAYTLHQLVGMAHPPGVILTLQEQITLQEARDLIERYKEEFGDDMSQPGLRLEI